MTETENPRLVEQTLVAERRKLIQDLYIRCCRDSQWKLESVAAAKLVGGILKISPLEVWVAIGDLKVMQQIASGEHPICK